MLNRWLCGVLSVAGAACVAAADVHVSTVNAEGLRQALARAYLKNPRLGAERARQKATDEIVPRVLAGWRPTVTANADYGFADDETTVYSPAGRNLFGATPASQTKRKVNREPRGYSITLSQPVFEGLRTHFGTKQAEADVKAGRQVLLDVQQIILLDGVTSYMNVIRDRTIVSLRSKNVKVLDEQLRASESRFKVGEITRTDVAQARARFSEAQSNLAIAKSNLAASEAFYVRIFGVEPAKKLQYPKRTLAPLPKSLKEAVRIAERQNPTVLTATFREIAAKHAVGVVSANLLPRFSVRAQYDYRKRDSYTLTESQQGSIVGSLSVPLYQGGGVYSSVREAKHTANRRRLEILDARREARQNVVRSWNNIIAAKEAIRAAKVQVSANELAFGGVKQEALVGSRTTLDVLDAEQELVNSQVSLVRTERELVVARYQLLASVGSLTADGLNLGIDRYSPERNYRRVRNKLFGTGIIESD